MLTESRWHTFSKKKKYVNVNKINILKILNKYFIIHTDQITTGSAAMHANIILIIQIGQM